MLDSQAAAIAAQAAGGEMIGEPDAGNPPVRFDEGVQETCGSVTRLCPTLPASPLKKKFCGSRGGAKDYAVTSWHPAPFSSFIALL